MKRTIEPIAFIRTDFSEKFGIPRQSGRVSELIGKIVFEPKFRHPDALREIEGFSQHNVESSFHTLDCKNSMVTMRNGN